MSKQKKIEDVYTLSPAQEGILYHMLSKKDDRYHIQLCFSVKKDLNVEAFKKSFEYIMGRYDIFRTIFNVTSDKKPLQVVLQSRTTDFTFIDLGNKQDYQNHIEDYRIEERRRGFMLTHDVLTRLALFRINQFHYQVMWSFPHILLDGWCVGLVLQELLYSYDTIVRGGKPLLKQNKYNTYISWLSRQSEERAESFWRDVVGALDFPSSIPSAVNDYIGPERANNEHLISYELSQKLSALAVKCRVSLNMIMQLAWALLLQRYNNHADEFVSFGTVMSVRPAEITGIEQMAGLFINTVPVVFHCTGHKTIKQAAAELQDIYLSSYDYAYYPLYKINKLSNIGEVFDHIFVFENYPLKLSDPCIQDLHSYEKTSFDFNFYVVPGKQILLRVDSNPFRYNEDIINNLLMHYNKILLQFSENENAKLSEIELLEENQKQCLWKLGTGKEPLPRKERAVHKIFEKCVIMSPEKTAILGDGGTWTYREVNEMSNRVAHALLAQGVGISDTVALLFERSCEMVAALLGVWKAGCVYLPIDLDCPKDRMIHMLRKSNAKILLTQQPNREINDFCGTLLALEDILTASYSIANPELPVESGRLAYILYTSGSTGVPKGVAVTHDNVVNTLSSLEELYPMEDKDVFLLKTSYTFDVSVVELFGWFFGKGSILVLGKGKQYDPSAIFNAVKLHNVTHINFVPSMFRQFLDTVKSMTNPSLPSLRYFFLAGETLTQDIIQTFYGIFNMKHLINAYGPTECTIYATSCDIYMQHGGQGNIPIGAPLHGTKACILSTHGTMQPLNIPGQLCLSGASRARGYIGGAMALVQSPVCNELMYPTGDIAVLKDDGFFEYLGRQDEQVKIRGYRVELYEIEAHLLNYHMVSDCVVLAIKSHDREKHLCAYYTSEYDIEASMLHEYLASYIPKYMVPAHFIRVRSIPHTISGKIDKKKLSETKIITNKIITRRREPVNHKERTLMHVLCEILSQEHLSLDDNFFFSGGDSIKAIQISAKLMVHGYNLEIEDILKHPIFADLSLYIKKKTQTATDSMLPRPITQQETNLVTRHAKMVRNMNGIKDMYHLSPMQEGMLFHALQDSRCYKEHIMLNINGDFNYAAFNDAFQSILNSFDVLRTIIIYKGVSKPIQCVFQEADVHLPYIDLSDQGIEEKGYAFEQIVNTAKNKDFVLDSEPLIAAAIVRLGKDQHKIFIDFHHIIMDGWSISLLLDSLFQRYQLLSQQKKIKADHSLPYGKYIQWIERQNHSEAITYWRGYMDDYAAKGAMDSFKLTKLNKSTYSTYSFSFDRDRSQYLRDMSMSLNVSLSDMLHLLWGLLLCRLNQVNDIAFGSVVSSRPAELIGVESGIGLYINTIPVRIQFAPDDDFRTILSRLRSKLPAANLSKAFVQLADILSPDQRENGAIDHILVFESYPVSEQMQQIRNGQSYNGLDISQEMRVEQSNYPWNIIVVPGQQIEFQINYDNSLFHEAFVKEISILMGNMVSTVVDDHSPFESKNHLQAEPELPLDKTICDMWRDAARAYTHGTALRYKDVNISYGQLEDETNRLAHLMRSRGVHQKSVVGVLVTSPIDVVIAFISILKLGAVYLPLDLSWPENRLSYIMSNASCKILLVDETTANAASCMPPGVLEVNIGEKNLYDETLSWYAAISPNSLAYIIYTSGSTGTPKGVMIQHKGLYNTVKWHIYEYEITPQDSVLQTLSPCFDGYIAGIFPPLMCGATVVLVDNEQRLEPQAICSLIAEKAVTQLVMTPTLYRSILTKVIHETQVPLKRVILGGESLTEDLVCESHSKYPQVEIVNEYGPTECSVSATFVRNVMPWQTKSIGRPISNMEAYVLSAGNEQMPVLVPGELCFSGLGLAKGYLNDNDLTENKFIFVGGKRIYKTGDLARKMPDGSIEFMGRIDTQIKIRGYRIEVEEIEAHIRAFSGIIDAVVALKGKSNNTLCAYYVSSAPICENTLKQKIANFLPQYMIPSFFQKLDQIPRNRNGKTDRNACPEPKLDFISQGVQVPPCNEQERIVLKACQEVLSNQNMGVIDNFFSCGGDSIKAIQFASLLSSFGIQAPVKDIMKYPNVRSLCEQLSKNKVDVIETTYSLKLAEKDLVCVYQQAHGFVEGIYPLTPMQKGILFHCLMEKGSRMYEVKTKFDLQGQIDINILELAVNKVIERHQALRACFLHKGLDYPVSAILRSRPISIRSVMDEDEFDLAHDLLFRIALVNLPEAKCQLILRFHHIIMDGWCTRIIMNEIQSFYNALKVGEPAVFNENVPYTDYLKWVFSQNPEEALTFWENYLNGYRKPQNQLIKENRFSGEKMEVVWCMDEDLTEQLQKTARKNELTVNSVLQALWGIVLMGYYGVGDCVLGTVISGRSAPVKDIDNIVGLFINTIPIRVQSSWSSSFMKLAKKLHHDFIETSRYSYLQLSDIQNKIGLHNLIDHIFVFENYPVQVDSLSQNMFLGCRIENIEINEYSSYGLYIEIIPGKSFSVRWRYNPEICCSAVINTLVKSMERITKLALKDSNKTIYELLGLKELESVMQNVDFAL